MANSYPNIIGSAQTAFNASQLPTPRSDSSYRLLINGDSMSDLYNVVNSVTATFDRNSGILTVTDAGGNAGLQLALRCTSGTRRMRRRSSSNE